VVDGGDDGTELVAVKVMKVGLPAAPTLPLDQLEFRDVGEGAAARRTSCCVPGPSPPFNLALYSGGPPTIKGWTPPIRARIKGLKGRWAYLVGDQPNKLVYFFRKHTKRKETAKLVYPKTCFRGWGR